MLNDVNRRAMTTEDARQILEGFQEDLAVAEGRLQLLLDASPELQARPDLIDNMEVRLFKAKSRVQNAVDSVNFVETQQLTGLSEEEATDIYWRLFEEQT